MEKKLYWIIESNADLSVTCASIETCMELLKSDFESEDEKEQAQYTLTPVWYTDKEYQELSECE